MGYGGSSGNARGQAERSPRTALTKIVNNKEFVTWAKNAGYNPFAQGPEPFWKSMADMDEVYKSIKPLMGKK